MKNQAFVRHLDCYIPEDRFYFKDHWNHFDNGKEAPLFPTAEKFQEFLTKYMDIESVSLETKMTQEEMTMSLLKKNIEEKKLDPNRVAMIIVAPDISEMLYNFGARVQYELNMPKAKTFRITDSFCANIDLAMGIAKMFLQDMPVPSDILLVAGNKLENSFNSRVVGTYGVMGDGVSMAIMTNEPDNNLAELLGQGSSNKGVLAKQDLTKDNTLVHFQGITECLKAALANTQIPVAEITGVVLHNANQLLITESIKTCGVKPHLVDKTNQKKHGHMGTTDLIYNLKTHIENSAGKSGTVLTTSQGVNGTYVSTLFKI
jgi:3-oxoacyl-[acyl-carrier-protein] synthase III